MVQFLDRPNEQPSMGQRFAKAFANVGQQGTQAVTNHFLQQHQGRQENQAIQRLTGQDLSGLSPDLKKSYFEELAKGQGKTPEKGNETAIKALDQMEAMIDKPGLGLLGSWNQSDKSRFNRGEFEGLQAAILPLFKSLFPRGMTEKEFKFVNDRYIPQAGDTAEKKRGKIKGLRQLVQGGQMEGMKMPSAAPQMGTQQSQMVKVKAPDGRILSVPKDQVNNAMQAGGQVVR